jgi:transcriptional regulator GlxA family with amidase domain
MIIAILLFDNYTALDVIGPYEVLSRLPGAQVYFVGLEKKNYEDSYGLKIVADYSIQEISEADILLVPGGFGIDNLLKNNAIKEWIIQVDNSSKWTISVCSGSILFAEAGLLTNKKCTTHWRRKDQLRKYNVNVVDERYVREGKIITAAGVSAGIDMALFLVSLITNDQTAKLLQLAIEYDPKPPFNSGSPDKAPEEIVARLKNKE